MNLRSFVLLVVSFFAAGCSCGGGYVGQNCPAQNFDISTEGSGRGCGKPSYFTGSKRPGESCSSTSECAPICCGCANGNGSALAAACEKGKCVGEDEACCRYDKNSDICRRGASSLSFHTCETDTDCESGLSCIKRWQVTSRDSQIGAFCDDPYQQRICTKRCTSDNDCSAYNGACTGADQCDGPKNLCHNK